MKKRIIAGILALCMPLALCTSCGSQKAVDNFFDTLDEVRNLKDYHLEMTINTDEAGENGLRISGDVAKSTEQAHLTLTPYSENPKVKGSLDVVVDGSDVYLKLADWTRYVAERYEDRKVDQDANAEEGELLKGIAKDFGSNYIKITAPEKVFDLLSGSSQKEAVTALSGWYQGLRAELKGAVKEKNGTYTLSLEKKNLQTQSLALLKNLIDNEQTYRGALQPMLKSVKNSIAMAGWTESDILDNIWSNYQEQNSALQKLQKNGKTSDSSFTMTDAEKGSDGTYQLSMIWKGDVERYVQANIKPVDQPAKVAVPKKVVRYSDQAENLSTVFMDSKNLLNAQNSTSETASDDADNQEQADQSSSQTGSADADEDAEAGGDASVNWDQWFKDNKDDAKGNSSKLKLDSIKGYPHLKLTPIETEDGIIKNLPVVTDYNYCDASFTDNGNANGISLSSNSWNVDIYGIDLEKRSLKDILSESMNSYVDGYKNDWGYQITQQPGQPKKNSDGTAYVAGFSYEDKDKGCNVTLVSLVTQMKGSSYAIDYEFALYGDKVQENNCTALKEFCQYFGLDVPVTIMKK